MSPSSPGAPPARGGAGDEAPVELSKILGRRDVLALAFGAMIGWGWVVLCNEMIERAGTVGSALAFVVGAVMVLFVGLAYAELTSGLSRAGGVLAFTYAAIGPRTSFVCGWAMVLAYLSVSAFESVALPTVLEYYFPGYSVGHLWTIAGWDVRATWVAVGVGGALGIGLVNYFGMQMAAFLQWTATALLFLVGIAFFLGGAVVGDMANMTPLFTTVGGFFGVVILTPFLYLGFDVIPQVSEEINIPFRVVGKLILFSIALALAWYFLVQWTTGLSLDEAAREGLALAPANAMSVAFRSEWGGRVLVFGGLMGIVTSWNAFFIGASRLLFAMSRGGMLPTIFSRIHPRYGSPTYSIVLITVASMVAPFFGRRALVWLADAGSLATVVGYFLVVLAFIALRRKHPSFPRPYEVPFPSVVGVLAVVTTVFFILLYMPGSPSALVWPYEWLIVLLWAALGGLFALGIGRRVAAMGGRTGQAALILGEYAAPLGLSAGPTTDTARPRSAGSEEA